MQPESAINTPKHSLSTRIWTRSSETTSVTMAQVTEMFSYYFRELEALLLQNTLSIQ
jgi:hypothetical protein